MKKMLSMVMIFVICIMQFQTVIYAATTKLPKIYISAPSVSEVTIGTGVVEYTLTFVDADEINISAKDIGRAGDGVTFTKEVYGTGNTRTVRISNVQGPVGTLVSIAVNKGVAKNSYGYNQITGKSTGFRLVAPTPVNPDSTPSTPDTGNNNNNNTNTGSDTNSNYKPNASVPNINRPGISINPNNNQENKNQTSAIADTEAPVIKLSSPSSTQIVKNGAIEFTVNYSDNVGIKAVNLTSENIKLNGFDAKIKIVDVSLTQKKIILRNIDAQVGTNCSISIFAGTSEDEASNKDTGVELSESFSIIVHPDKPQNAPEDWVPNPNTGR